MEDIIDLKQIYTTVVKNKWYVIIVFILSVTIMSIYLWFIATPIYQSKTQVLVNQTVTNQNIQAQEVQANLQLVDTYSSIVTSPRIITEVKKELKNKYSESELMQAIQVSNNSNSQILEIVVEYPDPRSTTEIANKTAEVFTKEIPKIMKVDNVTILSDSKYIDGQAPIKPHKSLMLALAAFIGVLISILIIFIQMFFDRTIKNVDELQSKLGLTLLGTVNEFSHSDSMLAEKGRNKDEERRT
ncbi:YveK family protein [Listeria aquatica]|uniref:YveK family protein n=1 Tax=Listeria aquatica TaxID=1494960 RepID=UPI003F70129D